jgi:hypothetical protein
MNKLLYANNLDFIRHFIRDKTGDLCYIDPPFNSKRNYNQIYNILLTYFVLKFIGDYRLGDFASFLGLLVSLVGFGFTLLQLHRTKAVAEAAKNAANQTQEKLRNFDTVMDFSSVITMMEDIKRHHRGNNWYILPDRYSALRIKLVAIKTTYTNLTDNQQTVLQSAIQQFKSMEGTVERALARKSAPANFPKLNEIVSNEIDKLNEVLTEIRNQMEITNYGR